MQQALSGTAIGLVTIGFSPPEAMRELAGHLLLTGPVLADEQRVVYRVLDLPRAPVWRVYSPGTLVRYAHARLHGQRLHRPVEDTRQLGGDAVVVDGVILRSFTPRTPDDRVRPARLAAAAHQAAPR